MAHKFHKHFSMTYTLWRKKWKKFQDRFFQYNTFTFQETGAKNIVDDLATKKKNMVLEVLNITANDPNLNLKEVVQEKVELLEVLVFYCNTQGTKQIPWLVFLSFTITKYFFSCQLPLL